MPASTVLDKARTLSYGSLVKDLTVANFGLLIAYLIPGFIGLWAISLFSVTVRTWLGQPPEFAPTVGGFLYVTLASIGIGLVFSLIRWLVIDSLHPATGLRARSWDFGRLQENVTAFNVLIEIHYRYYQFYANTLVAVLFAYGLWLSHSRSSRVSKLDIGVLILTLILFAGSRDTLRKYHVRLGQLLGTQEKRQRGGVV